MGTRHLIMVVSNEQYKVCQYGQWDGYPDGQGITVLEFLRNVNITEFRNKINKLTTISLDEVKNIDGLGEYKEFSRDTSSEILDLINENKVTQVYIDLEFIKDSLFCEWAYLIDLDNNKLEVYSGFNKSPLTEGDRFYFEGTKEGEYYPCKLINKYSLWVLPTNDRFIKENNPPEEE